MKKENFVGLATMTLKWRNSIHNSRRKKNVRTTS
jgi:hypothetical protein